MATTRYIFLEKILRLVYGQQPSDDSNITYNLANEWLNEGIALAAKQNYKDNIAIDGIGYVNNSFYTSFKNLAVTQDGQNTYKITLPQIPLGIGANEGVSTLQFIDANGNVSLPCIPLTERQVTFYQTMRPIQNKVLYYPQGINIFAKSTLLLFQYTAKVTMVSGGDASDLNSVLNVPADYLTLASDYVIQKLTIEKNTPKDSSNDGVDN
jgi:hypothetical protein|tara:strand:+ start:18296 stop:18925 length:630 start_codon:yes stop_codon:yes gene_type:complete